jgi:hypothetical protein
MGICLELRLSRGLRSRFHSQLMKPSVSTSLLRFFAKIRVSERFYRDVTLRMPKPHHTAEAPRCPHRQIPFVLISWLRFPALAHHPRLHCLVWESKYAQRSM